MSCNTVLVILLSPLFALIHFQCPLLAKNRARPDWRMSLSPQPGALNPLVRFRCSDSRYPKTGRRADEDVSGSWRYAWQADPGLKSAYSIPKLARAQFARPQGLGVDRRHTPEHHPRYLAQSHDHPSLGNRAHRGTSRRDGHLWRKRRRRHHQHHHQVAWRRSDAFHHGHQFQFFLTPPG